MKTSVLIASLGLAALAGCVETTSSVPVQATQAQTLSGTIVGVRNVAVPNQTNQVAGAVAGGLIGGLVGNQFGGGRGNDAMTAVGAIGGAVAGSRLAQPTVTQEWSIRLSDGRTVTIVQAGNYAIGQRVSIVVQGNSARIVA